MRFNPVASFFIVILFYIRIGDEYHALSGVAKDMGSAAVWLSLVLVLVTWIIISAHLN
jgi:diacylglycerol kinase